MNTKTDLKNAELFIWLGGAIAVLYFLYPLGKSLASATKNTAEAISIPVEAVSEVTKTYSDVTTYFTETLPSKFEGMNYFESLKATYNRYFGE